jgi:tripartite-type tricarboxylate transporter receptor subunit TctC
MKKVFVFILTMVTVAGLCSSPVFAQDYPTKVVRILTSEAGGGGDSLARLVAQGLSKTMGQQFIVDNRGIQSATEVARATPDGYTLLFYGSNAWISPLLRKSTWDPVRDFAPITFAADGINVLTVNPSVPAKTVAELIALAKAKPGEINFASSAAGSATHLAGELFKAMAGVNIVHIPYKGVAAAYNDLIAGRVQMMIGASSSMTPLIKAGKIRLLAVGNDKPSGLFPGTPTVAATVPGYESGFPFAMFAPAKTPAAIINRLSQETGRVLKSPESAEKLANLQLEVVASTPAQLAEKVASDRTKLGKVIKDAGISED